MEEDCVQYEHHKIRVSEVAGVRAYNVKDAQAAFKLKGSEKKFDDQMIDGWLSFDGVKILAQGAQEKVIFKTYNNIEEK